MNLVPTKSHSNYMGATVYHGPNVIWLWWPVLISGLLRLPTAGYVATPNPAKDSCPCASACAFTTTERALRYRIRNPDDVNALTCYGLVSSEVSHLIATMVSRHVVHIDNTDLHIPATQSGVRKPRNPAGPLRHMCHMPYSSHLEAHSPV
jgi:hypothetical protein